MLAEVIALLEPRTNAVHEGGQGEADGGGKVERTQRQHAPEDAIHQHPETGHPVPQPVAGPRRERRHAARERWAAHALRPRERDAAVHPARRDKPTVELGVRPHRHLSVLAAPVGEEEHFGRLDLERHGGHYARQDEQRNQRRQQPPEQDVLAELTFFGKEDHWGGTCLTSNYGPGIS
ncbi:hypothetical protein UB46_29355 [Burkholderiaceae bacterium 16]|nr:hypothetical protein UB46_29355 [Burkholderiaceae bacterium 16]